MCVSGEMKEEEEWGGVKETSKGMKAKRDEQ